ncbi:MAG: ABC transporter ATP-binding protein [Candidatus Bathyarchaeota archaeon]|jgi:ABC-type lipoprotein export system ATPase subunit
MIEAVDIYKSYGAIKVLESFNLKGEKGDCLSIYGRSGSGKTTLLKILASYISPDKGKVFINGKNVSKLEDRELAQLRARVIGFAFQEPLLLPYLTAIENVVWPVYIQKQVSPSALKEEAIQLLSELGLGKRLDHRPSMLSVGEKKRVDVARALLRQPRIIIADEPTSNLDSETSALVLNLFRKSTEAKTTVVYSTTSWEIAQLAEKKISMEPN